MAVPGGTEVPGYDATSTAAVITRALQLPGGADLIVGSLSGLEGALATPGRSGRFRSEPPRVQLAEWRYESVPPGRLAASHVVGGIVLAEQTLNVAEAGWHVARSLRQHLIDNGPVAVHDVLAMLEGLRIACG